MNSKKSIKQFTNSIVKKYHLDLNHNYKNSVFLVGSGRSGTTWVSSIINYNNDYRYIFEPFHPDKEVINTDLSKKYLRPEKDYPQCVSQMEEILSGKIRTPWVDRFNKKLISNKRLIKEIRAHLLLKWVHHNFPQLPIILLLRHPCAVVNSKIKLGWDNYTKILLRQPELVEDFLYKFQPQVNTLNTEFEKHLFCWCIENYVPLKQFKQGEIHIAFYENFCLSPKEEIERMFSFLGKTFNNSVLEQLKQPSALSRKESAIVTGNNIVSDWKKHLTNEQLQRSDEILNLFGLDKIYSSEKIVPTIGDAYNFMKM